MHRKKKNVANIVMLTQRYKQFKKKRLFSPCDRFTNIDLFLPGLHFNYGYYAPPRVVCQSTKLWRRTSVFFLNLWLPFYQEYCKTSEVSNVFMHFKKILLFILELQFHLQDLWERSLKALVTISRLLKM